ncbi:MAG TPA: selenoprotein B, partial [Ilumatobacteraceae bacterium]|nr:selenoprotein B [Ilumatobacteraceae bacterium]
MSVLAHVFEAAGIATVVLSSIREMAVKVAPPRALHCEFPLGRPLGRPSDPAFQHDVLARAFALLDADSGPVLVDHPDVIEADEHPVSCSLPPRFDPDL